MSKKRSRTVSVLGIAAALALALFSVFALSSVAGDAEDYAALSAVAVASAAEDGAGDDAGGEGGEAIDWDYLSSVNPDVAAWLRVDGTSIDLPVVQADASDPDLYLTRDFWGGYSARGCLYIDWRASADGPHALVYGHHIGWTSLMFSEIFRAYRQDVFDGIGSAYWSTPSGGTVAFSPALAMSVDKSYEAVQVFEFATTDELRDWLGELAADATASAPDLEELCEGATRALTLVTCSSTIGGQRARTLLVFVA